jgi:hypothetical protein
VSHFKDLEIGGGTLGGGGWGGGLLCRAYLKVDWIHVANLNKNRRVYLFLSIVYVSSRDTIKVGSDIK